MGVLLLGLFTAQRSVMARPAVKRWWARMVYLRFRGQEYTQLVFHES